ncbi:MAG: hypothetical protein U1D55_15120 [Phycisphaerae bacterium]
MAEISWNLSIFEHATDPFLAVGARLGDGLLGDWDAVDRAFGTHRTAISG